MHTWSNDERCHPHLLMIDLYLRLCKKDRIKSRRELSSELVISNGKRLNAPTIRRRLNPMDYKSYIDKKKTH